MTSVNEGAEASPQVSLTDLVCAYDARMRQLLPTAKSPADWSPMTEFVDESAFHRVGCFLDEQDWPGYCEMLAGWAQGTGKFDTELLHMTECGNKVFYEIVESHYREHDGKEVVVKVNSMTVFTFNPARKIESLRVYLQAKGQV